MIFYGKNRQYLMLLSNNKHKKWLDVHFDIFSMGFYGLQLKSIFNGFYFNSKAGIKIILFVILNLLVSQKYLKKDSSVMPRMIIGIKSFSCVL